MKFFKLYKNLASLSVATLVSLGMSLPVNAQDANQNWPEKPIHLVVSFNPGAGPDVVSRLISEKLADDLGQAIVVENKPGAGGIIAIEHVKRAKPDGYTLLVATNRFLHNTSLLKKVNYDPVKDFAPVTNLLSGVHILVVNKDLGVSSQTELIELLKANPGKYNFSSGGIGSVGNLVGELFKVQTGVDAVHIPFKGPAEAVKSVISGESQFAFLTSTQSLPNVQNGKLIALSVTSDKRADLLPDVPTIREAGLPDFQFKGWQGIVAPAGTPPEVVARLNQAFANALNDPEILDKLKRLSITVTADSPEEFAEFVVNNEKYWADVINKAGLKVG